MPYLKTKLKNDLCRIMPGQNLKFYLKNTKDNGQTGCCGHIVYTPTNRCVYVDTRITNSRAMYRFAQSPSDFSSEHRSFHGMNMFTTHENLADAVKHALECSETMWRRATSQKNRLTLTHLMGEAMAEIEVSHAQDDTDAILVKLDDTHSIRIPYSPQCIMFYINGERIEPDKTQGYGYVLEGYDKACDTYDAICTGGNPEELRKTAHFFKNYAGNVKSVNGNEFAWYVIRRIPNDVIETIG